MRISARLDEDRSHKLEYLTRATHEGTSEVVKRAIDAYYEQVKVARLPAADVFRRTGFVGCGEAEPELSEHYKDELDKGLEAKHDSR